jgi:phage terminase small subunit
MEGELNPRQKAFCREYVKDYNGMQSAIRAGYSAKTAKSIASTLLTKINLQNYIADLEKQFQNKVFISKEKILKELALIGFSSIDEHMAVGEDGFVRAKSFEEMPAGAVRAVKKIKEKRVIKSCQGTKDNPSKDVILDSTFEFELYDKPTALVNMGKELGMFRDRQELTGDVTLRIIYDQKQIPAGE